MRWNLLTLPALVIAGLSACGGSGECGEAECAAVCASAAKASTDPAKAAKAPQPEAQAMSPFEKSMIDPMLEDLRAGIRAWDEEGIGICTGKNKECAKFMGQNPGALPEGDYHVQAILRVPKSGAEGTWEVTFATECTTTRETANGSSSSSSNYSKTYTVQYINEERGARLTPLRSISSPNSSGEQVCDYTMTLSHPDGDRVVKGQWTVPAKT